MIYKCWMIYYFHVIHAKNWIFILRPYLSFFLSITVETRSIDFLSTFKIFNLRGKNLSGYTN